MGVALRGALKGGIVQWQDSGLQNRGPGFDSLCPRSIGLLAYKDASCSLFTPFLRGSIALCIRFNSFDASSRYKSGFSIVILIFLSFSRRLDPKLASMLFLVSNPPFSKDSFAVVAN